jgi:WD40 repeat protein
MRQFTTNRGSWSAALLGILATAGSLACSGPNKTVARELVTINTSTEVGDIDFSPDAMFLAVDSSGRGGTDLWDWHDKRVVRHLPEGGRGGFEHQLVRYNADGRLVAICHGMGDPGISLDVYSVVNGGPVYSVKDPRSLGGNCEALAFSPDGTLLTRLATGDSNSAGDNVVFYNTAKWEPSGGFRTVAFFSEPPRLGDLATIPGTITVPNRLRLQPNHDEASFIPDILSFSPNGKYLALAGQYVTLPIKIPLESHFAIAIVDLGTRSVVRTFMEEHANDLDWATDSTRFAVAEAEAIKVFNVEDGTTLVDQQIEASNSLVRYTSDSKYLVEAVDRKVEIWDAQHRELLQVIHAAPACIATSRDGHFLAMAGGNANPIDRIPLLSLIVHPNGGGGRAIVYALK